MLVDFVIELMWKESRAVKDKKRFEWMLYSDGSTNRSRYKIGVILEGPRSVMVEQSLYFDFQTTNNQARYKALIAGLKLVKDMGVKSLTV